MQMHSLLIKKQDTVGAWNLDKVHTGLGPI